MKKIIFVIAIFCIMNGDATAQRIKLITATSQHWAGGVCCRYGANYNFVIQTKMNNITPDTVWVNGIFYPIIFSDDGQSRNAHKFDSLTHLHTYIFTAAEFHDDAKNSFLNQNKESKDSTAIKPVPIKEFKGAAMITFQYKGKQCSFVVKDFTKLTNLMYP